jgi:hypothetical protein
MPHKREKPRKSDAIKVKLARQARWSGIILTLSPVLIAVVLALLLLFISVPSGLSHDR